jgi:hypothetical protein
MTAWQRIGEIGQPTYRRELDPTAMHGVKRIDVTFSDEGTLIISVETEEGRVTTALHEDER